MTKIMRTLRLALAAFSITLVTLLAAFAAAGPIIDIFEPPPADDLLLPGATAAPTTTTTTTWKNPCKDKPGTTWCAVLGECVPSAQFKELCKKKGADECDDRGEVKDSKTGKMRCRTHEELAAAVFEKKYAEKEEGLADKVKQWIKEGVSTLTTVGGILFFLLLVVGLWLRFGPVKRVEEKTTVLEGRADDVEPRVDNLETTLKRIGEED